jgi:hypothetical protein
VQYIFLFYDTDLVVVTSFYDYKYKVRGLFPENIQLRLLRFIMLSNMTTSRTGPFFPNAALSIITLTRVHEVTDDLSL